MPAAPTDHLAEILLQIQIKANEAAVIASELFRDGVLQHGEIINRLLQISDTCRVGCSLCRHVGGCGRASNP